MKDQGDKIVAVDFCGYSFLPPSFFNFALMIESLAHRILLRLGESSLFDQYDNNLNALLSASAALVPFGTNNIGESAFFLLSFPPCSSVKTRSSLHSIGLKEGTPKPRLTWHASTSQRRTEAEVLSTA